MGRVLLGMAVAASVLAGGDKPFGFAGLEIFKVGERTLGLQVAPLAGDALRDCLLVDNAKGSVCFLLQRREGEEAAPEIVDVNDVPSDLRFRRVDHLTEKRIYDVCTGDFNGDGRSDIAYHGEPEGLEIQWGGRPWGEQPQRFPVNRPIRSRYSLLAGDIDGNGRDDLMLLTEHGFQVYRGGQELAAGELIPVDGKAVQQAFLCDVNGDGRKDLVYTTSGEYQVRVRFGDGRSFGAEHAFRIASLGFLTPGDIDAAPGTELVAVQSNPLRVSAFSVASRARAELLGSPVTYAVPGGAEGGIKAVAIGDVDGDGRPDLCVALADGADIGVRFGREDGTFGDLKRWPTLADVEALCFTAVEGKPALVVASSGEKSLGVMHWDGTRLTFPRIVTLEGTPSAMTIFHDPGGAEKIALAMSTDARASTLTVGSIDGLRFAEDVKLSFPGRIRGLRAGDLNGDGRQELLVFPAFEAAVIHRWGEQGELLKLDPMASRTKSVLENVDASQVALCGAAGGDGPRLLVAQKNFVRAMRLDAGGTLQVIDQYGAAGGAALAQVLAADLDGDGVDEIVAYDATSKKLIVFRAQDDGLMQPEYYQDLPQQIAALPLESADLNADGKADLIVVLRGGVAVFSAAEKEHALQSVLSYEVERMPGDAEAAAASAPRGQGDRTVMALAVGDLNASGRRDIAFMTSPDYRMHVVSLAGDAPREVLNFPIVERKTGRVSRGENVRSFLIEDVTGDGLADVLVLLHDRLLLYPQDNLSQREGRE